MMVPHDFRGGKSMPTGHHPRCSVRDAIYMSSTEVYSAAKEKEQPQIGSSFAEAARTKYLEVPPSATTALRRYHSSAPGRQACACN